MGVSGSLTLGQQRVRIGGAGNAQGKASWARLCQCARTARLSMAKKNRSLDEAEYSCSGRRADLDEVCENPSAQSAAVRGCAG